MLKTVVLINVFSGFFDKYEVKKNSIYFKKEIL